MQDTYINCSDIREAGLLTCEEIKYFGDLNAWLCAGSKSLDVKTFRWKCFSLSFCRHVCVIMILKPKMCSIPACPGVTVIAQPVETQSIIPARQIMMFSHFPFALILCEAQQAPEWQMSIRCTQLLQQYWEKPIREETGWCCGIGWLCSGRQVQLSESWCINSEWRESTLNGDCDINALLHFPKLFFFFFLMYQGYAWGRQVNIWREDLLGGELACLFRFGNTQKKHWLGSGSCEARSN